MCEFVRTASHDLNLQRTDDLVASFELLCRVNAVHHFPHAHCKTSKYMQGCPTAHIISNRLKTCAMAHVHNSAHYFFLFFFLTKLFGSVYRLGLHLLHLFCFEDHSIVKQGDRLTNACGFTNMFMCMVCLQGCSLTARFYIESP